jgi:hypothetical protein
MEGLEKMESARNKWWGRKMVLREKGEKGKEWDGGMRGISARESGEVEGFLGCRRQQGLDRWL